MRPESFPGTKRIWAANSPEIKDAFAALNVQDAVIDGEIVALDDKGSIVLSVIARFRHGSCETAHRFLRLRSSQAQRQRPSKFTDRRAKGETGRVAEKAARRKFGLKAVRLIISPGPRAEPVGPRVTRAEMKRCHWVTPVMICQVKFTEWTRDDRLRQPVFLGLREDKSASEIAREH